jgi:1-phosphofructokinase family hexose kinase
MIITVTLNTAIDKTLAVPNFRLGRRHRTVEQTEMPGGKGVNVARVLKTLGQPVIATGLAGGATGTRIVEQLTQLSVLSDFVRIREESRTNTAVIDPTTGEQTEINERGPRVSEHEIELFTDKLLYLAQGASMCVFAGSLPREVDIDVYARLIRELKRLGVACVVDTDGDPLRRAVRAEPDVISPNVLEAEELVGHEFNDEEDPMIAVREMVGLGAHGDHDRARRLLRVDAAGGAGRPARALPRADGGRLDRAARDGRLRRRLPGRLRGQPLRRPLAGRFALLRRGVRRRVDPAPRRRARRPRAGDSPALGDRGRAARVARRGGVGRLGSWALFRAS